MPSSTGEYLHKIKNAASTNYTGFDIRSENHTNGKGQSMKDFSRLMSAHSQYQAKVYSQYYIRSPHAIMHLSSGFLPPKPEKSLKQLKPSGIKAIDDYYSQIQDMPIISNFRNATELNRLID